MIYYYFLQEIEPFNKLGDFSIEFNKKILLPDQITQVSNEKKTYFQFDGYIESVDPASPSIILEMKLGPTSLSPKEFKYLYYYPDAVLVYIFFFPAVLQHRHKLYDILAQKLEFAKDQFPASFHPELKRRVFFLGHAELGTEVTHGELLFAVNHELLLQILSVVAVFTEYSQKNLVGKDLEKIFNLHHARVDFLLDVLVEEKVLVKQVTAIKDSIGKLSPDATLFSLNPLINVMDLKKIIADVQSTYKLITLAQIDHSIPDREIVESGLSDNDISILAYMKAFPELFICTPDIRINTQIANSEVLNRSVKLANEGYLIEKPVWFIDKNSSSDKYYIGKAYKIVSKYINNKNINEEIINRSVNYDKFNDPSRISLDYPLTLNEIRVLLLLFRTNEVITISDLSEFFNLSSSTVEALVRRLADQSFITGRMKSKALEFLIIKIGWTLSKLTKRAKLAKSPLITLNPVYKSDNKFKDFINKISTQIEIDYNNFSKILVPVKYPLGIQETRLVHFLLENNATTMEKGIKPSVIYKTLILTSNPASNKAMVVRILKTLISKEILLKRFNSEVPPILKKTYDSRYFVSSKYNKDDEFRNYIAKIKREFY